MVYNVIGLMSGSSLDGLDIVFVQLTEVRGGWSYETGAATCVSYSKKWEADLRNAPALSGAALMRLHADYGRYLAEQVNAFMQEHALEHKVHFVASHGHTVFHEPGNRMTFQLGCGANLAAGIGLPVISDLRAVDVALGGQGAPIVPAGDKLLFGQYEYLLNLGGIANISIQPQGSEGITAFDVCACNQVLNALAQRAGKAFDDDGALSQNGVLIGPLLEWLNAVSYFRQAAPKSLSNDFCLNEILPLLEGDIPVADLLHTVTEHIAMQVADALKHPGAMLVTGGGALNHYLIKRITHYAQQKNVAVMVPDEQTVMYKEAIVMALIGALRWREEASVFSAVTGAAQDSIAGALWKPF